MREFIIATGGQTVVATTSLMGMSASTAPNINVEFLRYWIGYTANATSNQQRVELGTQAATFPTFTLSNSPSKMKYADPNASVIVGTVLGTTQAGSPAGVGLNASSDNGGVKTVNHSDAFNVLNGWLHVPTPPETRILPSGFTSCHYMWFPVSPTTLTNWSWGIIFREV